MNRRGVALVLCTLLAGTGQAFAKQQAKVFGPPVPREPWEAFVFTEKVANSDIPVDITLLETIDGLYTPIGLRHPKGKGPFPIVLFFTGNGGAGVKQVRDYVNNYAYTMERFLAAGYAVGWLNYRAEVWFEYTRVPPLQESHHQANQLLNRPPLEYNDMMYIVDYVKRLPYVDANKVGLIGNSHGGGMILKAAAEGMNVAAAIVSEPDCSELLQMDIAAFSGEDPQYPTIDSVVKYFNKPIAMDRIRRIKIPIFFVNRDHDPLQGIFETAWTWMKEAGRNVEHVSYDHPVHGYIIRVPKDEKGVYRPDKIHLQVIQQAMDFFKKYMAP
jgi:dipeptidyl aminopeptidase/acylaminoacyl peptidase